MKRILILFTVLNISACAGTDWSRNVYEGIRQHQEATTNPGAPQPSKPMPDYEQYKKEREALKATPAESLR